MKTYIKLTTLALLALVGFVSCDDNDETPGVSGKFDVTKFAGEWCMPDEDGTYTILKLSGDHSANGESWAVTDCASKSKQLTGAIWYYYPQRNTFKLSGTSELESLSFSGTIKELTDSKMTIFNQNLGSVDEYYKITDWVTANSGECVNIPFDVDDVINRDVMDAENGMLLSHGIAFVIGHNGADVRFAVVKSLHRSESIIGLLGASVLDVMEKYGTPDAQGVMGNNMAILYKGDKLPSHISVMQLHFDPSTFEITRILTVYPEMEQWNKDVEYWDASYNYEDGYGYFSGIAALESPWQIAAYLSGGQYYASYINIPYFLSHNYY